jgi:hypothetical protein
VVSQKLKDQCRTLQTKQSTKNLLYKERQHQRKAIQQQLDRMSANKDQLCEIINGLELMKDELVNEVKKPRKISIWQ